MPNKHLSKNHRKHNEEYFTRYIDIENELKNYEQFFKNKIVYCNCDSASSNFVKYFKNNFDRLGLKKLNFSSNDFKSEKSIQTLIKSDIICTNPPFSYLRDFIDILLKYNKKFIIIGSSFLREYAHYYQYLEDKLYWITFSLHKNCKYFVDINGNNVNINCYWYTNIGDFPPFPFIKTGKIYHPDIYPKIDGTDIIYVSRTLDIPDDYDKEMAVPTSFIERWNQEQFSIRGLMYPYVHCKKRYCKYIIKRISHGCN